MIFSIIVPIYKVENYLKECVESVQNQSFSDWELILVDDGSPDNCPAICDQYVSQDTRIKVVHKKNGGLVSARKAGLEVANGQYVVCLDGDDFLRIDCLRIIYDEITKYNPDVVSFGYFAHSTISDIPTNVNRYRAGFYDKASLESEIYPNLFHSKKVSRFPGNLCSKAIKLDLYKKYQTKVSSAIGMGEDGACCYPILANCNSIVIINDCLYYYRQIETSMSKVPKPLSWNNFDMVFALYESEINFSKHNLREQMYRARTHNLFNISMSQFYSGNSYKDVVNSIKQRFKEHPEYDVAIKNCSFSSMKMRFCQMVLKYRLYGILYVYAKNKSEIKKIAK